MPFGMLAGLSAALAWGTLDLTSALTARHIGSLLVSVGIVAVSAVILGMMALATGTALPADPAALGWAAFVGIIGTGAYLSFINGLRVGPITVVSGMVAAYGGLTVVLAVAIRGETLTVTQAAGAAIATIGVVLTGVSFDGGWRATRLAGPGVVFAVVALVLFSAMAIATDVALESAGWLQVLLVARIVNTALLILPLAWLLVSTRRRADESTAAKSPDGWRRGRIVATLVAAGALDVIGLTVFAIGLETAPTWMVGLASSFGPVVPIIAAVAFLGERLKPIQWTGLVGIVIGMVAIAIP